MISSTVYMVDKKIRKWKVVTTKLPSLALAPKPQLGYGGIIIQISNHNRPADHLSGWPSEKVQTSKKLDFF